MLLYLGIAFDRLRCPNIPLNSGSLRLNSLVNAPIKTYQAIRFNMNAYATIDIDRAAVEIDKSSNPAMTIMALPRELRDIIYEDLFSTQYPFDAYRILNGVPYFSKTPIFTKPCSDSRATPATGHSPFVPSREFLLYKYPFPSPPSLDILETSTRVREEALHVLYRKGTLLFVLNNPRHPPLSSPFSSPVSSTQSQELITHFNNVEIFLDLLSIFNYSLWPGHEDDAINLTMELIERLGDSTSAASICTLSTYYAYDRDTLRNYLFKRLLETAGKLCVFKKVVLRFGNKFTTAEEDYTGSITALAAEREWAVDIYRQLSKNEKLRCLGPCEESYDSEGFYCMVFHPRDYGDGGGSSNTGSD